MFKYSDELINKTIKYFKERHNHIINEDTACEYLESMSGLFSIFVEHEKEKLEAKNKNEG